MKNIKKITLLFSLCIVIFSCKKESKEVDKKINAALEKQLDEDATVYYTFEHDASLIEDYISLNIGGEIADITKKKIEGVNVSSAGDISVIVRAIKGVGNWELKISKVELTDVALPKTVEPNSSGNIHVTSNVNKIKNIDFTLK